MRDLVERDFVRSADAFPDAREVVANPEGSFQSRVRAWVLACFGDVIAADTVERADRFIEEALELVQATGYSAERAHALVDYVFGRPVGEPGQEVGGVMNTLAALCNAHGLDMEAEGNREMDRVEQPAIIEKIRAKQRAKPTGSALPIALDGHATTSRSVGEGEATAEPTEHKATSPQPEEKAPEPEGRE